MIGAALSPRIRALIGEADTAWSLDTSLGDLRISTTVLIPPDPLGYRYETLVFRAGEDIDGTRYRTDADARAGHHSFVERWRQS